MARRTVPEGIRITKVGLWYILLAVLVAVPATNTGNNALYLVEASLLALLVVSGVTSRQNLRKVEIDLTTPEEIYARRPFALEYSLRHRGRVWHRRLLVIAGIGEGKPVLVPYLAKGEAQTGLLELTANRRGLLKIPHLHISSIYPLGFFRKGIRYRIDLQLLVFPQILTSVDFSLSGGGAGGEDPARRAGPGHELFMLRSFRPGDDRRRIHWKQSARTGELIYLEREAEKGQRISIQLDNGVGELTHVSLQERFERLVSEAATAVQRFIDRGYEVELVTRNEVIGFGRGRGHRRRILESLALIAPTAVSGRELVGSDPSTPRLRFAFEGQQS